MTFPLYQGTGSGQRHETPAQIPIPQRTKFLKPEKYVADPGLRDACNVALLLGQPLLLTGEPGTGKTQFAYSLAWELGFEHPLKFETKSDSIARDLFYRYDALKRFQDVQSGGQSTDVLEYISYQALGLAILQTRPYAEVQEIVSSDLAWSRPKRSVVLIDEVDKAPRDFPNDLLNELEHLYFRVSELGNVRVDVGEHLKPIIIMTSNSEKDLPDAFLRRCVYYNIPFPEKDRLKEIIASHLGMSSDVKDRFLQSALDLFYRFRSPDNGLRKKPATAEFLAWIRTLKEVSGDESHPQLNQDLVLKTLSCLVKTSMDQDKARSVVAQWQTETFL